SRAISTCRRTTACTPSTASWLAWVNASRFFRWLAATASKSMPGTRKSPIALPTSKNPFLLVFAIKSSTSVSPFACSHLIVHCNMTRISPAGCPASRGIVAAQQKYLRQYRCPVRPRAPAPRRRHPPCRAIGRRCAADDRAPPWSSSCPATHPQAMRAGWRDRSRAGPWRAAGRASRSPGSRKPRASTPSSRERRQVGKRGERIGPGVAYHGADRLAMRLKRLEAPHQGVEKAVVRPFAVSLRRTHQHRFVDAAMEGVEYGSAGAEDRMHLEHRQARLGGDGREGGAAPALTRRQPQ